MADWSTCKHVEADSEGVWCKAKHGDKYGRCKAYLNGRCSCHQTDERRDKKEYGEWKISPNGWYPYCSRCGYEPKLGLMTNYCPNCGVDMRGKKNNESR